MIRHLADFACAALISLNRLGVLGVDIKHFSGLSFGMDYIKKAIWGPDPKEQVSGTNMQFRNTLTSDAQD